MRFLPAALLGLCATMIADAHGAESNATGLVYHPDYLLHDTGPRHPEQPARLEAIMTGLDDAGLLTRLVRIEPRRAQDEWLLTVHSRRYLEDLQRAVAAAPQARLGPDTRASPASYRVATLAAGGVLAAVDAVMDEQVRNAFVAARPPGHHALADRAMGFCLINNVAVAARYLQQRHHLERVLIVDFDVHHGNGTQEIFYDDPSVFYFSTHQYPYYPGTGAASEIGSGAGSGTTLNVPLAAGVGDAEIIAAFRDQLMPAAERFEPQFILVSAGFDAHRDDPLAQLAVTEAGYAALTAILRDLAERHAGGRLVSVLEGGYQLDALARSVAAHVGALAAP